MRGKEIFDVGLIAAVLLVCTWSRECHAAAPEIIPAPEWAVGDWWEGKPSQFRDRDRRWTVIDRRESTYVLVWTNVGRTATGRGSRFYGEVDGRMAKREDPNGRTVELDTAEWVRFPLIIGGYWTSPFRSGTTGASGDSDMFRVSCRATGWESIDVASRSIRAVRIDCRTSGSRGGGGGHTAWYAPDAKRVVRLISDYARGPSAEITGWNVRSDNAPMVTAKTGLVSGVEIRQQQKPPSVWSKASSEIIVNEGDQLRAAAGGSADVTLPDGSLIHLAENTRITITKLRYSAETQRLDFSVHITTGKIRAEVVRRPGTTFFVSTPNVVSAVRGGQLVMSFSPKVGETFVAAGPASHSEALVTVITPANGAATTVRDGYFTTAKSDRLPAKPAPVSTLSVDVAGAIPSSSNTIVSDLLYSAD